MDSNTWIWEQCSRNRQVLSFLYETRIVILASKSAANENTSFRYLPPEPPRLLLRDSHLRKHLLENVISINNLCSLKFAFERVANSRFSPLMRPGLEPVMRNVN